MAHFITGIAGFIGCNLAARLLDCGQQVFGVDNLSRGRLAHLASISSHPGFSFQQCEMTDLEAYRKAVFAFHQQEPITEVWHLAANSDIPAGADPAVELRDTFMTTFNTLAVMKSLGIGTLHFSSSSAIYGDLGDRTLSEDTGPLLPISNYGAMKLASEAIISAAAENHLERAFIFRFPNVIGTPATHGVIMDFIDKLKADPTCLAVLGDGLQQKQYLHVDELIEAMLFIRGRADEKVAVFNIGPGDAGVQVRFIAEETVRQFAPGAGISYGQESKGWVGDVPRFSFCTDKLSRLGWRPALDSQERVRRAIGQIIAERAGRA